MPLQPANQADNPIIKLSRRFLGRWSLSGQVSGMVATRNRKGEGWGRGKGSREPRGVGDGPAGGLEREGDGPGGPPTAPRRAGKGGRKGGGRGVWHSVVASTWRVLGESWRVLGEYLASTWRVLGEPWRVLGEYLASTTWRACVGVFWGGGGGGGGGGSAGSR